MISLGYGTLNHRYLWFSQINLYKWLLPIIAFTLEDQRGGLLGETANSLRNLPNPAPFLSKTNPTASRLASKAKRNKLSELQHIKDILHQKNTLLGANPLYYVQLFVWNIFFTALGLVGIIFFRFKLHLHRCQLLFWLLLNFKWREGHQIDGRFYLIKLYRFPSAKHWLF